jgi:oxalate decarboxylase/phosphoglucose isomerase-like protein (cupin superfamily)
MKVVPYESLEPKAVEDPAASKVTTFPIGPGHVAYVPAGSLHQFANTDSSPLVFVCVVPRRDR